MLIQKKGAKMIKGILVSRISHSEQESIPVQTKILTEYAKKNGIDILEVIEIKGESAFKGKRNKFTKALQKGLAIADEKFALVVYDCDRFSRNVSSPTMVEVEKLRNAGKLELHIVQDNLVIHKDSRSTDLTKWKMLVLFAEMESSRKSDKIRDSIQYKLSKNEYPGYMASGYDQDTATKKITIDLERAPLVKELYEMYATGEYSTAELTKIFRGKGFTIKPKKNKKARLVGKSDILQILHSRVYTGDFEWAGNIYKDATNYEAIISRDLWKKVQEMLHKKAIQYSSKHFSSTKFFRYRGLLKCGFCGCTMTPSDKSTNYKNGTQRKIYYRCSYSKKNVNPDFYKETFGTKHSGTEKRKQKISKTKYSKKKVEVVNCPALYWTEEEVDVQIKNKLKVLAFDSRILKRMKMEINKQFKDKLSVLKLQIGGIEVELEKKESLIGKLVEKAVMADFKDIADDIQNQIKVVKSDIAGLKTEKASLEEFTQNSMDEVVDALSLTSDLYSQWDGLDAMSKRRVALSAFSEISLKKGWLDKPENYEKRLDTVWTESFRILWEQWKLDRELDYEAWVNKVEKENPRYFDNMQEDDEYWRDLEEKGLLEKELTKMKDSI